MTFLVIFFPRRCGRNARFPVILISGDGLMKYNTFEDGDKTGYLIKPVSKNEVLAMTEMFLA